MYDTSTEYFNDLCPQVMAIGVTYDEFWHGDPELVRFVIETEEIKQRNEVIRNDLLAWNTGRYVMVGVGVVLSQAFSKSSTAKYPTEPLIAAELDDRIAEQKRERELRKAEADFLAVGMMLRKAPTGTDAPH